MTEKSNDPFTSFFGGGRKIDPDVINLPKVTLAPGYEHCNFCKGLGYLKPSWKTCRKCAGKGLLKI